jgi:DNA-binding response OmpR family regulator
LKSLLIIEDDESLRESLEAALGDEYELRFAASAEEGLACLAERRPDLMVLDERLPGLSGTQLLARLGSLRMPAVILVSANADIDLARRALHLGARDCLTKPFDLMQLRSRLRQMLSENGPAPVHEPFALLGARRIGRAMDHSGSDLGEDVESLKRDLVEEALYQSRGDVERAGRSLQLDPSEIGRLRRA